MPSRSGTPPRKFSTRMSAVSASFLMMAMPSGFFRSSGQAALVAVHLRVKAGEARLLRRRQPARNLAVGGFDLDHIGAQVAQLLGAQGAGDHGGDIDDADALEWAFAVSLTVLHP